MTRVIKVILLLCIVLCLNVSCHNKKDVSSITIAEQYGLAYAPLQIMKAKKYLEELQPDAKVTWVKLANTAAIREAVLSGDVDTGFLGIPPFLIACDQKMPWKIATGLSQAPLGLVVSDADIRKVEDFGPHTKLALPQPGSIQHILLGMALQNMFGDYSMLDNRLVSMKHPDGMNALLGGSIEGHFTSPPYIFQESDQEGFSVLISGEQAMGEPFTFIVGMATEEFFEKEPELYRDYLSALDKAVDFINTNRSESVRILAEAYGMEEDILADYLYRPGMVFETEIRGLDRFLGFMKEQNIVKNLENSGDVVF